MPQKSTERLFRILLFLLPIVLLGIMEVGLRIVGFAHDRRVAFKPIDNEPGWVGFNPEYAHRYFRGFLPALGFTPFRVEKPEDGIRVVALGGSSTAGFPYQWYNGFPAAVERRLMDAFPGRPVEVINLGMTAVNSYTLNDLTRHVVDMEPDLVLIYAGHNEFYGALGAGTTAEWLPKQAWFGRTWLQLKRSALVLALERVLVGPPDYGLDPGDNDRTMMARVVQNAAIEKDGAIYRAGIDQFESNMRRVVSRLQSADIPIVAGTLVSNLSGQPPLSRTPDALEAYAKGSEALAAGDTSQARTAFEMARDLDQIRFRASGEINAIIRTWGNQFDTRILELEPVFDQASDRGIPGYDLFTDHLHPTQEGYELMGAAFADAAIDMLAAAGQVDELLDWQAEELLDPFSRAHAGILIDRLLSDYPFNLTASPDSTGAAYAAQLRARRHSGRLGDSLAVEVMTTPLSQQNALYEGARIEMSRGDTLAALGWYHSLFYWQPFNDRLMEEVIGTILASPSWDPMLEKLALHGAGRSDKAYFWNALAVTQIRQENWDQAASALAQAERVDPDSPIMLYNRARLELALGDSSAARATFEAYRRAVGQ